MALWWPWGGFGWLKRSRFGQLSVRGVPSAELLCSLAGAIVLSRCRFGHSILPSVVHPNPQLPTAHFRGQQPSCHQFVTRLLITLMQKVLAFWHQSSQYGATINMVLETSLGRERRQSHGEGHIQPCSGRNNKQH